MTKKRFSQVYATFEEWQKQAKFTSYTKEIEKRHAIYPRASLSQLRRHPAGTEKPLGLLTKKPIYQRPPSSLSQIEKLQREKSLKVISVMRREKLSLSKASKSVGISPKTVIKNTNALKFVGNKWIPKLHDKIIRIMDIYTDGQQKTIAINDSRTASIIGKYHNAVKNFFEKGDIAFLKSFKGKKIKDADGNTHTLETDPDRLFAIAEGREDEEFYSIYK
jgi:hypothetical protein